MLTNTDAKIMREAGDDSRRHMEWSTKGGPVLLSYPAAMTADDVDDVEALFVMTIRILRRRSGAEGAL